MDLQKIKTLLDFVGRSRVSELTVSDAETTVVIRNPVRETGANQGTATAVQATPSTVDAARLDDHPQTQIVRASTSGIVHRSNSPGSAPLVAAGDPVEVGQALCIVEAMKVFTTISTPFGGIVKRVFFEDGQEVSFGDALVEIG
ncbi:acetyl-CoA carboxylase biotin carboxyl carrier protein subunit (plasmid) [Ensifer adhaerens]|uniref:acetyl-CoA carboxylase biotin carboxyl carrier protein n=1 Tax=Ensifer adhaerens TaxID=106592 RepID=UPI0023AA0124|nr:acetyl-CoA carboxylase biotin carboxyl carrier protein subunit [Ensifer adhaerens]WDZ79370.1 acetyl-CoA carboxylase biotin carboxyl carrier protein subunit [Ensifer adhaerens]